MRRRARRSQRSYEGGRQRAGVDTLGKPIHPARRRRMSSAADRPAQEDGHCAAGRTVFVSLELSRTKWLVTSLSPGSAKMAKHVVTGGDGDALLALVAQLRGRAEERC